MSPFKEGDVVRIKKDIKNGNYGSLFYINDNMERCRGFVLTIKKTLEVVDSDKKSRQQIYFKKPKYLSENDFDLLVNNWSWDSGMVESYAYRILKI